MTTEKIIQLALEEDLGAGDHTSLATIPKDARGSAQLISKSLGILAGGGIAAQVFRLLDPELDIQIQIPDGMEIEPGDIILKVGGSKRSILSAERTALNFIQRLSGIATATYRLKGIIEGTKARLLDTRKTTPLLRGLEKYAVRTGGGYNHRMGLYDMIMIKNNHIDLAGSITKAIRSAKEYLKHHGLGLFIEIEVRNMKELKEVLAEGGVDRIMLDNFTPADISNAIELIGNRFETEASGGITEENIREYAETGVDYISVGALTHKIHSLDMSLRAC
ncbi:MAG: carboxylating nicotinate-nucleotide diphosphorylase [Bacteroidales bacterium]|nr:carboxylating nicotinate-nucleotide diphosphorylase [Bacteroidales bacterium]